MSETVVGIIANPASGKDIRRLTGHATTVDNQAKVAIVRRALMGLGAIGVDRALLMPDSYNLGERALQGLGDARHMRLCAELLDMDVENASADSERAAALMRQAGAGCLIVLGGDGTARAASKGAGDTPLLPISTGTNNVLPTFVEGTVAGLAAGAVARGAIPLRQAAARHKWLEVAVNGAPRDRALVDVAALAGRFVGSRAIWDAADLRQVIVTRADPATIGISAIAALVRPIGPAEPLGLALTIGLDGRPQVRAAIGPGLFAEVGVAASRELAIGELVAVAEERPLMLALDGEREIVLYPGDDATVTLRADGPWIVNPAEAMREIVARRLLVI